MEGETSDLWNKEGYRVDLTYYQFDVALFTSDFRQWLIDNYKENSAFAKNGRGKQQYMCTLDEEHIKVLLI